MLPHTEGEFPFDGETVRIVRSDAPKAPSLTRGDGRRRSLLPDFLIGANAAVAGYRLLTRDTARYRTYYPSPHLIAPID